MYPSYSVCCINRSIFHGYAIPKASWTRLYIETLRDYERQRHFYLCRCSSLWRLKINRLKWSDGQTVKLIPAYSRFAFARCCVIFVGLAVVSSRVLKPYGNLLFFCVLVDRGVVQSANRYCFTFYKIQISL